MKDVRSKHREDYWNMQTQIENKWLTEFQEERTKKLRDDMDRWRTNICTVSLATKNQLNYLDKKADKTLETMRRHDIKNTKLKMENTYMLDAFKMEQKRWPNLENLNESVD